MFKIFNRGISIFTNGFSALKVNGTEVLDKDGKLGLGNLASGITPSHVVKFAGTHTTVGGAASEDITVTGAAATDIVSATLRQKGATPRTILTALAATDKITLTFSGDPSTDHKVDYVVFRAAA